MSHADELKRMAAVADKAINAANELIVAQQEIIEAQAEQIAALNVLYEMRGGVIPANLPHRAQ